MGSKKRLVQWQRIHDKKTQKDYSAGEASPYNEWLEAHPSDPFDEVPESAGFWHSELSDHDEDLLECLATVKLTPTERRVLRVLQRGDMTQQEVGALLNISRTRVEACLRGIREKTLAKYRIKNAPISRIYEGG